MLFDPYSRAFARNHDWSKGSLASGPARTELTYGAAAKSVVLRSNYQWSASETGWRAHRKDPNFAGHRAQDLIIYEVHPKGFTASTASVVDHPGTQLGVSDAGTDPSANPASWNFFDATFNGLRGNNDEYTYTLGLAQNQTDAPVFRFSGDWQANLDLLRPSLRHRRLRRRQFVALYHAHSDCGDGGRRRSHGQSNPHRRRRRAGSTGGASDDRPERQRSRRAGLDHV